MSAASVGLRASLFAIFAIAAVSKARRTRFREFADTLASHVAVSVRGATALAVVIMGLEVASAVLVAITPLAAVGFALSGITMALLTIGVATIVRSDRTFACNCFGAAGGVIGPRHLLRNGILLAGAVVGFVLTLAGADLNRVSATDAFVMVTAGAFVGICVARLDDLLFVVTGAT